MSTFSHFRSVEPRKEILENSTLHKIADFHNKSVVQIVLRWMLQQNIIMIPKTWEEKYLKENISIIDVDIYNLSKTHCINVLFNKLFV